MVEDEHRLSNIIKKGMVEDGFAVDQAFDGDEGLYLSTSEQYDLIVLDIMLPKLNGFDVLKETREKFTDKWRPVIIISALAELDSLKKCYALEADHYLTKPVSIEKILQGIETMISLIPLRRD